MVATADPQDPKFLRPPRGQAENRLCMCWIPHRWWVQGSGWLQLATRHLRPALLPLSYEYLSMLEHRQPASFANTSSHHSYTTSNLLSQALDVGPSDRSNSNTPDILQHFLTYHINLPSTQFHPVPQSTVKSRAHRVVHTTTPPFTSKPRSHWLVRCSTHPGPGSLRERWHLRTNSTA